jgi:hypothetical protein
MKPGEREAIKYQAESLGKMLRFNLGSAILTGGIGAAGALGRLPGARTIRESLEIRKRERYFQSGRDEQGRKLTKRELQDREAQRSDMGALGYLREVFEDSWGFKGKGAEKGAVPVRFSDAGIDQLKEAFSELSQVLGGVDEKADAALAGIGTIRTALGVYGGESSSDPSSITAPTPPPVADTAAKEAAVEKDREDDKDAATKEAAVEKEREDDKDAAEAAEKQEGLFGKLIKAVKDSKEEGGGLFGLIATAIGGFASMVAGKFGLLLGKIAPILTILGKIAGFFGLKGISGALSGAAKGTATSAAKGTAAGAAGAAEAAKKPGIMSRMASGIGRGVKGIGSMLAKTGIGQTAIQAGSGLVQAGKFAGKEMRYLGNDIAGAAKSAAKPAAGWLSSAWNATKGFGSRAVDAVARLNPLKYIKNLASTQGPKLLKGLTSVPAIGAAIEAIIGALDIASVKGDETMSPDEKKTRIGQIVGKTIGSALGTVGGSVLGGAVGSLLGPGPGTAIGSIAGAMGGSWLGGTLGEALADALGPREIYDILESIPGIGSLLRVDDEKETAPMTEASNPVTGSAASSVGQDSSQSIPSRVDAQVVDARPTMGSNASSMMQENSMLRTTPQPQPKPATTNIADNRVSNNATMLSAPSARIGGANQTATFNGLMALA